MPYHTRTIPHRIPVVVFGGGAAGLWLLDELTRRGTAAILLEARELGRGQTVSSQGILHGGLKYTLQGLLTRSAEHIRDMPAVWRDCLAGRRAPELTDTPLRAGFCYLWRIGTLSSRLGMFGAKMGLRVAPQSLDRKDRPPVLADCPGTVARLNEQVISPAGFIANLAARNAERILKIDAEAGLDFAVAAGRVERIRLRHNGLQLAIEPGTVVLAAGAGNARLREQIGLAPNAMQRRPLHMLMLRGNLPALNGHCVDGRKTRVTITSDADSAGRTVWQVGGQLAEDGVAWEPPELIRRARRELQAAIPGLDLPGVAWATYRVDRAEPRTPGRRRPETFHTQTEANVVTAWPTKLVLVPKLAEVLADQIATPEKARLLVGDRPRDSRTPPPVIARSRAFDVIADWPRPAVAQPPWETAVWYNGGCPVSQADAA